MTLDEIIKFATNKHNLPSESQRYGNVPYDYHLKSVDGVFNEFKYYIEERYLDDVEKSVWCHDLIEDTDVNEKDISKLTNHIVADIVFRVTNERGYDRKERNFKTYPKIWVNDHAIFVKLCDRISNARNSKKDNHRMYSVYKEEYPVFRYAIKVRDLYSDMWDELDKLFDYGN